MGAWSGQKCSIESWQSTPLPVEWGLVVLMSCPVVMSILSTLSHFCTCCICIPHITTSSSETVYVQQPYTFIDHAYCFKAVRIHCGLLVSCCVHLSLLYVIILSCSYVLLVFRPCIDLPGDDSKLHLTVTRPTTCHIVHDHLSA